MSLNARKGQSSENNVQTDSSRESPRPVSLSQGLGRSPRNSISAVSPETFPSDQSSEPSKPSGSQNVPGVFKNRDRGFSLRRTLFAKNINMSPQARPEVIELTAPIHTTSNAPPVKHEEGTVTSARSFTRIWRLGKGLYTKASKTILGITELPPSADGRHIFINEANLLDERTQSPYLHNSIRSSRYSFYSFFPRQLFAQFSKLANAYFLAISILQLIPGLSTTGQFTTIVPLLIFVGISMGKEGWDDIRRWKLDKEENNRTTYVLNREFDAKEPTSETNDNPPPSPHLWTAKRWLQIKVGDIIRLKRDDQVPADMILMYAEGTTAYTETMALDGETNLKNKQPPVSLLNHCRTIDHVPNCHGEIVVEDPSMDLYRFEGKISIADQTLPLTTHEVMYRGSILRNTPVAVGIVCYTGEECRIRQNANKNPRIKAPALQSLVNRIVILIAGFVLVLSLGCSFGYSAWNSYEDRAWFLFRATVNWGQVLASFIIMFNTLLPLSLYVSMEIVKVIQIFLMNSDVDLFDEVSNTPMQCQTSTINEELGQVSFVFSDKTGTLTKNEMKVNKLSCAGYVWNHESDINSLGAETRGAETRQNGKENQSVSRGAGQPEQSPRGSNVWSIIGSSNSVHGPEDVGSSTDERRRDVGRPARPSHNTTTTQLIEYIYKNPSAPLAIKARFFLLSIALCHTCIPESSEQHEGIRYQATSPDELALVTAAQEMGYLFLDRQSSTVTLKIFGSGDGAEPVFARYEVLHVIEFTSDRKRMSVIVREPDGRICIHCKGADSVVRDLLRLSDLAAAQAKAIEQQTTKERSLGAQEALRRQSTAPSLGRPSFDAVGAGRRTSSFQRKGSVRYSVDQWPSDRGADTAISPTSPVTAHTQSLTRRTSGQPSSRRSSMQERNLQLNTHDTIRVSPSSAEVKHLVDDNLLLKESWVIEQTLRHLNEFANEGLRTLLHAARYISEDEYRIWAEAYREATTSLTSREERISEVADLIEKEFELIGATAIEDKLQDGVPETVDRLRRANIKLWMLTGDKRETAISISRSCRLAKDYSTFIILDNVVGPVDQEIANALLEIEQGTVAHAVLVVDGGTLASIEGNTAHKTALLDLAILVDSVICCRASPSQKAMLVKSIRRRVNGAVTLAIGDGANDVAMIQEADVGIGISGGKEGLQAARTSDYAIAQFRFLCKLLLVHGRYNYDRISKYILGTTYKEMLFYLTQALYQRSNGYTGTSMYESWSLSWYNAFFTSLPIIFLGAFMAELSPVTLLAVPELYTKGQRKGSFNFKLYLWWNLMATVEAMLVFFIMYGIYARTTFTLDNGLFAMGVMTYTASVIIVNMKLQVLEIHNKNILAVIALVVSIGAWFAWNLILSAVYENNVVYNVKSGLLERFGRNALWWLTLTVIVLSFLLFELAIKALKANFFPSDVDVFQVYEQDPVLRQRFEVSAAPFHQPAKTHSTRNNNADRGTKAAVEADRDAQVEAMLQNRASDKDPSQEAASRLGKDSKTGSVIRKSIDVFSKGFGLVRKEHLR